jgi:hypothetical protein
MDIKFFSIKEMMGKSSLQERKIRLRLRSQLNLLISAQKEDSWRPSTWACSRKVEAGLTNLHYFA